ncbi:hypothetical protein COCON_G00094560 [Conger conger]|uniref:Centrosomal protein of 128 kDa n=1 Tax=Conger conger TaxID=82655 RepID=A0A9Q1DMN4_CONCO|nr:hypothetical protein COCON_G00094560 [Conger conger]
MCWQWSSWGELQELRSSWGEVEELRRTVERKERERAQLCVQVEALSADLDRREQQQLRMLEQLKEIQAQAEECQAERARAEAQSAQSDRRREEVKSRAQEALRQWKAKCRKLELSLEEQSKEAQLSADKTRQALKERDGLQVAQQVLSQQAEALRKELADVLGRLAQREEEVRRQELELSEARSHCRGLEQEAREVREASRSLEEEAGRQGLLEARLREETRGLEARVEEADHGREREHAALLELRGEARELGARLAHEEEARKEAQRRLEEAREEAQRRLEEVREEAQRRLEEAQEEARDQAQQLRLERELHQSELASLKGALQDGRVKQERAVQETLRLCQQERKELQDHLRELKAETAADKDKVRAHRRQVEQMKAECDKLTEELSHTEEGHSQLHRKYQLLKQELEEKAKLVARGDDCIRNVENAISELRAHISRLEAEQESVLSSIGAEIDAACKELSGDSTEKLKAISLSVGLHGDPHRWLAETKTKLQWLCEEVKEREARARRLRRHTKLQWLCEEVKEREARARRLRRHVQQSREEMKCLKKSKDAEQQVLLERIAQQEGLLENLHGEKRDLLEKTHRRNEEMRGLQDRISDLELSTKLALDHLESVPDKLSLLENFKDLEESQRQREMVEQRYARYKEIVGDLQHQLEESKRRIQDFRDEKMEAASHSIRLAALSSSIRGPSNFLSSSRLDDTPHKLFDSPDFDRSLLEDQSSPVNGI